MHKFLIVTADDFGLDVAVNEAVQQSHVNGILTAASLMVAAPAAAQAVEVARSLPGLRVGLHVVLADGSSILPRRLIPDLVDANGRFATGMLLNSLRFVASLRAWQNSHSTPRSPSNPRMILTTSSPLRVVGRTLRLVGLGRGPRGRWPWP